MLYLPYNIFSYTGSWNEMRQLLLEIVDMDDESLIEECDSIDIGNNLKIRKLIDRFNSHGMPLSEKDRINLMNYYILTHVEEVLEI